MAVIDEKFNVSSIGNFSINGINILPPGYKLDKTLTEEAILPPDNSSAIAISYYSTVDKKVVEENLLKLDATIIKTKFDKEG